MAGVRRRRSPILLLPNASLPGEKVQKSTLPAMAYKQQHANAPAGARSAQPSQQQQQQQSTPAPMATIFDRLDVIETSFHLIISRLEKVHL